MIESLVKKGYEQLRLANGKFIYRPFAVYQRRIIFGKIPINIKYYVSMENEEDELFFFSETIYSGEAYTSENRHKAHDVMENCIDRKRSWDIKNANNKIIKTVPIYF